MGMFTVHVSVCFEGITKRVNLNFAENKFVGVVRNRTIGLNDPGG